MPLVAILDSGVTQDHPHIGNVVGGIAIMPHGTAAEYVDWLGHGTAVAAAIHEKAPAAQLLIVKIFARQLAASIDQLVMGIEWALDQGAHFINLSLGTQTESHCDRLRPSIARSQQMGSQIISARHVNGNICFPGSLQGVVGVEADPAVPRDEIRYSGEWVIASPFPRPIPGVPTERNLHGISFAVANATGHLAGASHFRNTQSRNRPDIETK
jgi:hypothetical protein